MIPVTVLDYGIGNLTSVARALQHCGADVQVLTHAGEPAKGHVVLPGVGAFPDAMDEIRHRGFDDLIASHVNAQRPFLGICVGMQVMFSQGEEYRRTEGLGLIEGSVVPVPEIGIDGRRHRIPLVGWGMLSPFDKGRPWSKSIFSAVKTGSRAYFVHSYSAMPVHPGDVLAEATYDGVVVCAAVQRGSAIGCQFHPEKSAETGLTLLRQFLAL